MKDYAAFGRVVRRQQARKRAITGNDWKARALRAERLLRLWRQGRPRRTA